MHYQTDPFAVDCSDDVVLLTERDGILESVDLINQAAAQAVLLAAKAKRLATLSRLGQMVQHASQSGALQQPDAVDMVTTIASDRPH